MRTPANSNTSNPAAKYSYLTLCIFTGLLNINAAAAQENLDEQETQASKETKILDVIQVTARKRAENATDVPMSINAFSASTLEAAGINNASDLVQITPGLTYAKSPTNTPIFTIRGVGFNTSNLSSTATVGLYVDEMAYAYPYMANGALFDMQRVEVLKGPQGTLYGRNTTGGLVNFITNKPTDELTAEVSAEFGSFDTTNFSGTLNLPISDTVAVRFATRIEKRGEGYQRSLSRPGDTLGEKDTSAFRASLAWHPNSDLEIDLSANYWRDKSDTVAGQIVGISPDQPDFLSPQLAAVDLNTDWDSRTAEWDAFDSSDSDKKAFASDSDFLGLTARVEYTINDELTFTSLTGHNSITRKDVNDLDGTSIEIFYLDSDGEIDSFSQEFRIDGEFDGWDLLVGVYYSKDDIIDNQLGSYDTSSQNLLLRFLTQNLFDPTNQFYSAEQYAGGFRFFRLNLTSENTSKSIFGKVDVDLTDDLQLSLGLRYTEDKLESVSCSADYNGNTLPIWNTAVWAIGGNNLALGPGPVVENGCITLTPDFSAIADPQRVPLEEDNLSGRISLSYNVSSDWLAYSSISRGFKSGAWPVITAASSDQLNAATQEKVIAYELGSNIRLLSGAGQLNSSVFYYDYEDKQLLSEVEDLVFQTLPRLVNIPKSKVYGAELDFAIQLTDNFLTRLGASYTKTEVDEYTGFNRRGEPTDFAGANFAYTPEWQLTGTFNYNLPLNNGYSLDSNLSISYRSDASAAIGPEPDFEVDSYALVNATVNLLPDSENWSVGLYATNLLDEYYWTSVDIQTDSIYRIAGMPREFGLRLKYEF
uniref:TonB-dependent receptor n=1 Tax=Ningiella ruwaisensis TaxID=2364274 RepID=UPI00109F1DB3|nr:TonB-dependent receptor [Ningiella ruwaisensis]